MSALGLFVALVSTACVVAWLFSGSTTATLNGYDVTDNPQTGKRSGLRLLIDHGTGCHYVQGGPFGGITPRLGRDGRQICEPIEIQAGDEGGVT